MLYSSSYPIRPSSAMRAWRYQRGKGSAVIVGSNSKQASIPFPKNTTPWKNRSHLSNENLPQQLDNQGPNLCRRGSAYIEQTKAGIYPRETNRREAGIVRWIPLLSVPFHTRKGSSGWEARTGEQTVSKSLESKISPSRRLGALGASSPWN